MLTNNKDWSEYMYYSPAEWDSEWKGLYRNSALSAISHYAGRTGDDTEWNRKMLHFSTGLHDVNFSKKGKNGKLLKNGKEVSRKFVSQNPDEVIHLLLGDKFDSKDIKTWEDIFAAMESKDFEHKKDKKAIYKRIIKDIEHKGYPIPPELEKYR
jgi:oligoribonuclease NrnB/cAMP/cGMP phosphodiesterase (DHH superfamily)